MSDSTPHPLLASSPATFVRVLSRYGFDAASIPRVLGMGMAVLARQPLRMVSYLKSARATARQEITEDPLFVVGHWRSGTTHLQNLLSQDPQFANVTLLHAALPHEASLLTGRAKSWMAKKLPATRLMDNLPVGMDVPWEEELGMAACSRFSYYHISSFGKKMDQVFRDTVLLEEVDRAEQERWWKAYHGFLQGVQLTQPNGRLLLKNPANTARVRLLLEKFPDAGFLHLHRNPYEVFISTVHLHEKAQAAWGLQAVTRQQIVDHVLGSYPLLMQAWLDQKDTIPRGQLTEMRFEDLVREPLDTLRRAYTELGLEGFAEARPGIEEHLSEQRNYQRNRLRLSEEERGRVAERWKPWFEALGYEP